MWSEGEGRGVADRDDYTRRELVRNGLVLGGGAAAFAITLSKAATSGAATTPGSPSVAVAPSQTWPWGAAVNAATPFYLGVDLTFPLLAIPITVTVSAGAPPAFSPPFTVQLATSGTALGTMGAPVAFQASTRTTGEVFVQPYLLVVPVVLGPGSLQIQATLPPGSTGSPGSITISGDFSQAPSVTTLSTSEQISLLGAIASGDGA